MKIPQGGVSLENGEAAAAADKTKGWVKIAASRTNRAGGMMPHRVLEGVVKHTR